MDAHGKSAREILSITTQGVSMISRASQRITM